jgi:hypothetical protein
MEKTEPEDNKEYFKGFTMQMTPRPREVGFVLEDILSELRQIRETMEKTGAYPVPNPNYPVYPGEYPGPNPIPWYPPYYFTPSVTNVDPKFGVDVNNTYTPREMEDKFGVKK